MSAQGASRARLATILKSNITQAEKLTNNAEPSSIVVYSNEIETSWSNYGMAFHEHESFIAGKDDAQLNTITTEFVSLHNSYLSAKLHMGKLSAANPDVSVFESTFHHGNGDNTKTIKLPPVKLTMFDGDKKEWPEFKATCRSILTDKIPDIQRLQYLKEALRGEPRELVQHVFPADGAYDKALCLLKERYENSRSIVNEHLRRLYTLPRNDPSQESMQTLRKIITAINGLIAALNGCEIQTDTWDSILIYNTSQCLHPNSLKAWEERLEGSRQIPKLKGYLDFLEMRITILETTTAFTVSSEKVDEQPPIRKPNKPFFKSNFRDQKGDKPKIFYTLKTDYKCYGCNKNHLTSRCNDFALLPLSEKRSAVQRGNLCFNCLQNHNVAQCPFLPTCKKCTGNHHTLLHEDKAPMLLNQAENPSDDESQCDELENKLADMSVANFYHVSEKTATILATALIPIRWNGRSIILRALIDQGSTANLITTRACQMLNLPHKKVNFPMKGVGNASVGCVMGKTMFSVGSIHDATFELDIQSVIVKTITELNLINAKKWSHLRKLQLADPQSQGTHKIDLLLGAAAYAEILLDGVIKGNPGEPVAQQTKIGWIVFGAANVDRGFALLNNAIRANQTTLTEECLFQQIEKFWSIEEVEFSKPLSSQEQAAEDSFVKSVKRDSDGKFIVDLPFMIDPNSNCLGETRLMAERRFASSQRRFSKMPHAKQLYDQNLHEYLTLGHMEEIMSNEVPRNFLPHHPVVKESSSTTKVRTVFDASAKSSNGRSLNDILCVGPTIQLELFDLLLQWRRYRYAFSGDIEKMYRMVKVNPEHALFQCILCQDPVSSEIKTYKLTTVTFGTASAPFQAIRAVFEAGVQIGKLDSELGCAIRENFYVDDYLGTTDKLSDALRLRKGLTDELEKFGFNLRKWKANDSRILENVSDAEKEEVVDFETTFKTLGVSWRPTTDTFLFKSFQHKQVDKWTKRQILSKIAQLYDPLGFLSPCVSRAKMLMQEIWKLPNTFDWDTPVPNHIVTKWQQIYMELCLPIPIQIPRWIGLTKDATKIEIHGFSDSSNLAYAACVYIVTHFHDGKCVSNLLASKTKLAPIKTISIPRLELCGAVLLAKLMKRCVDTLMLGDCKQYAWTDSMIVLAWLSACSSRWTTFVANRVTSIKKDAPNANWKHVSGKQNPADIASRGASILELNESALWWHGPNFVKDENLFPQTMNDMSGDEIPECRKVVPNINVIMQAENYVLERFSNFKRLLRFTVYVLRWFHKTKNRIAIIRAQEMTNALQLWVKVVQGEVFHKEIRDIRRNSVCHSPAIAQLTPFIDEQGILRMNGRVGNADMLEQKTAIILPSKHWFTTLIIRDAHESVLHGGVQLTLRKLRDQFWIVHARNQVKTHIHECVICFRYRKRLMKQRMAELPLFRTEQMRPFAFVGCDYAGFFEIKVSIRKNSPVTKGYIALFICLTTKALHLELVSDLSTAEFVMAFENFIAKHGIPNTLFSDNGTNFIGGAKEIQRLHEQMFAQNNGLTKLMSSQNIKFRTIPARASHMAGIWERAVGSVKYHLRRVLKDTKLTARHFDHVLKQIEACLNSRPLWAITTEGDDIEAVTPSHFSNFRPINTLPRPDLSHIHINKLDQYQFLYRLYCSFWKAWSNEYLHQLQGRTKWQKEEPNAMIGQIVLISEDNLPPSRWAIGKIVNIYPDKSGLIRTVDVKCLKNILRRPIHRLALLPIPDNNVELPSKAQSGENVDDI